MSWLACRFFPFYYFPPFFFMRINFHLRLSVEKETVFYNLEWFFPIFFTFYFLRFTLFPLW